MRRKMYKNYNDKCVIPMIGIRNAGFRQNDRRKPTAFIVKVQRDLQIRNRATRINQANSNLSIRRMLLFGLKKTTNIDLVEQPDDTEAGFKKRLEFHYLYLFGQNLSRLTPYRQNTSLF